MKRHPSIYQESSLVNQRRLTSQFKMGSRFLFLLLPLLISLASPPALRGAVSALERQALIDIYNGTSGANWNYKTNWLGAAGTECTWYGVSCNGTQTAVVQLNLSGNRLAGSIPSSLGINLRYLQDLYLNNQLTGTLPRRTG